MAKALKCDRCGKFFEYDVDHKVKNFIVFGYRNFSMEESHIINDICPDCMIEFMNWMEMPKIADEIVNKSICDREKCKGCDWFGWVYDDTLKASGGYYTCRMMNRKVENPLYTNEGAKMISPKDFLNSDIIFKEEK